MEELEELQEEITGGNGKAARATVDEMELETEAAISEIEQELGGLLDRDRDKVDSDSDLLVYKESGDKSLQGIKDRVMALEKLLLDNAAPKKAWQSYWIVMREFWNAATEGPGIQTLYPHELGIDNRSEDIAVRLGDRNTEDTEPSERVRRPSLVHILMPDSRRITITMPSMIGKSKSNI